ncbi:polycystin 2 [Thecamonas trahens ATCC 50062]|uniref:Polycystin 2 n=1 Tax=Thecamonas trahens ATCC 50062 TaxID=461836 RepID=A0A0L0D9F5_THETB|nr:polycystin 2 [Thecamonas trahens ATCC 50062]KNC48686.1 polycystin 2 [Thecamonas trahens ATCC 50062]|eukprot:XP_013762742.1 polycystin 2 [Thecamonas trahens ATCC 50062]
MNTFKKIRDRVTVVRLGGDSSDDDEDAPSTGLSLSRLLYIRSWTFSTLRYFVFLTLFTIIVFGSRPSESAYYMSAQLRDILVQEEFPASASHIRKTFWDVATTDEMFQYMEGPLLEGLFPTVDYAGDPVPDSLSRAIYGYDQIVGLVRIRQVRIRKDTCSVADKFKRIVEHCYDSFKSSVVSKDPFGPPGNEWVWQADRQTLFGGVNGRLSLYPDDGFVVDLAKDKGNATQQISFLKQNKFVDLQTRLLAIEFSVYNANLNLFCVIRIAFELPEAGGVVPFAHFRTVKLLRYLSSMDYFVLVCELLLCAMVFMYVVEEVGELVQACRGKVTSASGEHRGWRAYFVDDMWNYLDVLNLSLFVVVIIFRIIMTITLEQMFDTGNFKSNAAYFNLQGVALMATQEININAINMLLCWIKTLKYLNHFDRIHQLSETLVRAAADTVLFMIMFLIIFFGYAQAGYMMFSADVEGFRTIFRSMESLVLSILGEFDYSQIERSNRYLAPLFFFSYMLLVFFVLLNVFIAIISSSFDSVREAAARRDAEQRVEQLLSGKVQRLSPWAQLKRAMLIMKDAMLVKRYHKRSLLIEKIRSGKGDINLDGMISRDEALTQLALNDEEAAEAFDQYDENEDNQLDADEIEAWLADLREEKLLLEEALSDFMELEQGLAETGKKLSREQIEHREEISKRLEDYKKRVARMGSSGDPGLRKLEIRKPNQGGPAPIDPNILRLAANAEPAAVTAAISDSHNTLMRFLESINTKIKVMNNRLKRLEDSSRQNMRTAAAAGVGTRSRAPTAAASTITARPTTSASAAARHKATFDIPGLATPSSRTPPHP